MGRRVRWLWSRTIAVVMAGELSACPFCVLLLVTLSTSQSSMLDLYTPIRRILIPLGRVLYV